MSKKVIAFYINLEKIKKKIININLENGNPGIGGTQYIFLLTIKYINRLCNNYSAKLLTNISIPQFDEEIPIEYIDDERFVFKHCENSNIDFIVINANIIGKFEKMIADTKVSVVGWAHNTLSYRNQKIVSKNDNIKKVVCVSKKQYENMKDSICFNKCTYINNIITQNFYDKALMSDYSKNNVIYIGSIMPQKGLHNLLNIWKYVEKINKEAELYVFGGASIWNNDVELGTLKIADKYYDKVLVKKMNHIKNKEKIHFMGAQGFDTIQKYLINAKVGIVNPSKYRRDETFCMSALELGTYGIPIISRERDDGLNTTIINNKNGFLEKKDKKIAERICLLIENKNKLSEMGIEARQYASNFIVDKEILKWDKLLSECKNETRKKMGFKISKDSFLLFHDFLLKIIYIVFTGKIFYIMKKKLFKNKF